MYPFVLKITWWYDFSTPWKEKESYFLTYAETFTDACAQAEHYCGNIDRIDIIGVGEEGTLFEVTKKTAENFIKNGAKEEDFENDD